MTFRTKIFIFCFVLFFSPALAEEQAVQESDQQISEFSLSGYGDKGKKAWDLAGKTADIFDQTIKLKDITGKLYGEQEDIVLTADKGDFDKIEGKVHLEDNVVINTSSGATLTTDTLDWDRKNQIVSTAAFVNITKESMITTAVGALGQPNLNKVTLDKDVKVEIQPQEMQEEAGGKKTERIIIICDGPLNIDYEKNLATFNNNVKVDRSDSQIYSDTMDVFFNHGEKPAVQDSGFMGAKIDKIIAKGNVKIVRGENVSYSEEAIYDAKAQKITLSGKPKLIFYQMEDFKSASLGD